VHGSDGNDLGVPDNRAVGGTIVVSDLDGTLATADVWRGVLVWVKEHHPSSAADRFVAQRLPSVVLAKAGLLDQERFRARWYTDLARLLAGLSASSFAELASWVADEWLWPARRAAAVAEVQQALVEAQSADPGARLVVATGAYQQIADRFARRLGADLALGTPVEVVDGRLTGRLAAAVQTGRQKASAVRSVVDGGVVAAAFGDSIADIPMLQLARRPVVVAPDQPMRRAAQRLAWEVLDER
jgi:phosphoserine phosphatase